MGDLYFIKATGEQVLVKPEVLQAEIYKEIVTYVHKINPDFEIPYIRYWKDINNDIIYDVGSHFEFFKFIEKE